MKSLADHLGEYAAYHADPWNRATHFVGVPLVTFSLFLVLSWFRFAPAPDVPLTGATLFFAGVFLYYLRLDWRLAACLAPSAVGLLAAAEWAARLPFPESGGVFLAAFAGGWAVQLVGHWFEGRRPALADNVLQVFNAPLFLTAEAAVGLGFRADLRAADGRHRVCRS